MTYRCRVISYIIVKKIEGDINMIESRCGILCSQCTYKEQTGCRGCVNIEKPFGEMYVH